MQMTCKLCRDADAVTHARDVLQWFSRGERLLVVTVRQRKTEGRAGRRNGAETLRRMNTKKINISAQQQRGEEEEEVVGGIKMLCERPQQEGGVVD